MGEIFEDESWSVGKAEVEGLPHLIRMRSEMPKDEQRLRFPKLMVITWSYSSEGSGLPGPEEYARMRTFEDALEAGTEARTIGVQAVSLTGAGVKEWRYYTGDGEAFMASLNLDLFGHDPYPLDIQMWDDAAWLGLSEILASAQPEGEELAPDDRAGS